ncbi:hypothetical protein QBC41DRAFT_275924 [Cercophora samala]|uniref:Endonuclease III homolog n=1 Tax=Cercophora samala TaxID=330535 RepID=A0AA39ZDA0_9PEZI|nr:hypothetical protein QBC41DRAFT_275924 [Cercophora samala]
MRTSRVAKETARLFESVASTSTPLRRSSRTSTLAARFSYNTNASPSASMTKVEESDAEAGDDVKMSFGSDIEDAITTTRAAKRRRTATTAVTTQTINSSPVRRTTRVKAERTAVKSEAGSDSDFLSSLSDNEDIKTAIKEESKPAPRARARKPARRVTSPAGTTTITPPSDWEEIYNLVKEMRINGPAANAAVDTMGCERLADPSSTVKDRRFHTLVALMLSSQTKDTVNAEAMKRLHTELPPFEPGAPAGLNLNNMLHCPPAVLNELIGKVGFHNNKTKYLLQTAQILKDKFNGDIPPTIEGLVSLPGVGPKMAHLCMSAENGWNRVEGIGVDVHVHRITNYWGWNGPKETKTPEETRMALQSWLPNDKWKEINWLLVGLGQSVCLPVGRRCGDCEVGLKGLCKAADRKKVNDGKKRREGLKKEEELVEKIEIKEDGEGGTVVEQEQQRVVKTEVVDNGMPPPPSDVQPEPTPQPDTESNVAIPSVEQDVKPVIKNEEDVEVARSVPVKPEVDDIDEDMVKKEEEDAVRIDQSSHQPEANEDVEMSDDPEVKVEIKPEPPRRRRRIPATIPSRDQSVGPEVGESDAEVKVEVKPEPLTRRARIPAHIPSSREPEVKVEVKTEFSSRRVRIPAHITGRDESDDEAEAEVKTEIKPEPFTRQARIPAHIPERQPSPEVKVEVKTERIRRRARIPAHVTDGSEEVKREPDYESDYEFRFDSYPGYGSAEDEDEPELVIQEEDLDIEEHEREPIIEDEDFDTDSVFVGYFEERSPSVKDEDSNSGCGFDSLEDEDMISIKGEYNCSSDYEIEEAFRADALASDYGSDDDEMKEEDTDDDDEIKEEDSDDEDIKMEECDAEIMAQDSDYSEIKAEDSDTDTPCIKVEDDYSSDYEIERSLRDDALASDYGSDEEDIKQEDIKDEDTKDEDLSHGVSSGDDFSDLLDDHLADYRDIDDLPDDVPDESYFADVEWAVEPAVVDNRAAIARGSQLLPFVYHDSRRTLADMVRERRDPFLIPAFIHHNGYPYGENDWMWSVLEEEEEDYGADEQDGLEGEGINEDDIGDGFAEEDEAMRYEEDSWEVQMAGEQEGLYLEDGVTDAFGLGYEDGEWEGFEDEEDVIC